MSTEMTDEPIATGSIELQDGRRIHAVVDQGYGGMVDTFLSNFAQHHDLGAACAVYRDGRLVVDLWGGIADARTRRPWRHDTAAVIFSCSKGLLAVCAYLLVQERRLDLDLPMITYWPSFGSGGKSAITVRDVMSHRAGLAALDVDLRSEDVLDWATVVRAIEAQSPRNPPSMGHDYHPQTYGWLVGEIIRRITGLTPGRYFRLAVAERLGLQTWIGLPADLRPSVAWMEAPLSDEDSEAARAAARIATEDPYVERAATMSGAFAFPAREGLVTFNDPAFQAAEIPGANGISTAESLARLYAACVSRVEGSPILSAASLDDALRVQAEGRQLSGMPDDGARWGTGFQLASAPAQPMLGSTSFGHAGAGGQLAFADRDHGLGFAYLGNQMGGYGDSRARELTMTLHDIVGD